MKIEPTTSTLVENEYAIKPPRERKNIKFKFGHVVVLDPFLASWFEEVERYGRKNRDIEKLEIIFRL